MFTFSLARLPRIEFGAGAIRHLPARMAACGKRALVVTGAHSAQALPQWPELLQELARLDVACEFLSVAGEPSPALVDAAVARHAGTGIDCVVGLGGGSALDAAKAIAGLLKPGNSVMDHLEGVGPERPYLGPTTPFIAVPTTAGTGSEATKNAVLSLHGVHGFKKSFRDDALMAQEAIIDPDLLATCPPAVLAANGMDAFTQLLESYVSSKANPFTDALALSGMARVNDALLDWYAGVGDLAAHRADMAYAALLSGITLAHVGLGSVHGLASPLGAFFPIPHGVACGTLLAEATRINLAALAQRAPHSPALRKYADIGRLLARTACDDTQAHTHLLAILDDWTTRLQLPRLREYGIQASDISRIVANSRGSSMKTNPVVLDDPEVAAILHARL